MAAGFSVLGLVAGVRTTGAVSPSFRRIMVPFSRWKVVVDSVVVTPSTVTEDELTLGPASIFESPSGERTVSPTFSFDAGVSTTVGSPSRGGVEVSVGVVVSPSESLFSRASSSATSSSVSPVSMVVPSSCTKVSPAAAFSRNLNIRAASVAS